jgi:hypothetical protein
VLIRTFDIDILGQYSPRVLTPQSNAEATRINRKPLSASNIFS